MPRLSPELGGNALRIEMAGPEEPGIIQAEVAAEGEEQEV